jgi:hypothetical protein
VLTNAVLNVSTSGDNKGRSEGRSSNDKEQRMISGGIMERQMLQEPIMIYIGVDSVTV